MIRLTTLFVLASLAGCNTWADKTSTTADSVILRGGAGATQAAVKIKLPTTALPIYHLGDTLRCAPATYDPNHLGNLFIEDSTGNYRVTILSLTPVLQ